MALSSIQDPPDASTIMGTSSSSRHQAYSTGRWYDCAVNKSNSTGDMSTGDTGVQKYRGSGVQEYQMSDSSNNNHVNVPLKVIIMNMQHNAGVRCNSIQSGVTILGQVITCQVQVSDIKCQVSGVK